VESGGYRISGDTEIASKEHERLRYMGALLDPGTRRHIDALGIAPGWRCLEVGAGAGTVSSWLGQRVGLGGEVLSIDLDLRFHVEVEPPVEIRQADLMQDPLPGSRFDLAHARAVVEHLPDKRGALERMLAALKPGGWLVIEDSDFVTLDGAPLPEPFKTLHELTTREGLRRRPWWDRRYGAKLLPEFQALGLEAVDAEGAFWTMVGGTPSAESYVLALEHSAGALVDGGLIERETVAAALAQARQSDFLIASPLHAIAWGRKPTLI